MEAFLKRSKEKLVCSSVADDTTTVHAVLGNESCDLDSAVCALVWAFYLDKCKGTDGATVYAPVLNIPRKDYRLRTEVVHACKKLKLDDQDLTFRDEIDLVSWQQKDRLRLTLVDHNVLSAVDSSLEGSVVEVIDHHQRDRPHSDSVAVTLELVGSCCTLLAERLLQDEHFEIDSDIAWLLSGPILVDTVCLSEAAGRTTPKDESIIQRLQQLLPELVDTRQLFDELQRAKMDVSDLSTMDVLRKDLKSVTAEEVTVAISSVPMHMTELLGRADLQENLTQLAADYHAGVIVVMSLDVDEAGAASRQLAVWSQDSTKQQQLLDSLSSASSPSLDLGDAIPCAAVPALSAFYQGNVTCSRKKVLPLVQSFLQGHWTPDSGVPPSESVETITDPSTPSSSQNLLDLDIFDPLSPTSGATEGDASNTFSFDPLQNLVELNQSAEVSSIEPAQSNTSAVSDLLDLGGATFSSSAPPQIHSPVVDQFDSLDPFANHTGILMEPSPEQGPTPDYIDTPEDSASGTPHQLTSIPSTPPNSLMERTNAQGHAIHVNAHDHTLPSFHNSEMMRKIQEKKAQMEVLQSDFDMDPYLDVPQNSYAEGHAVPNSGPDLLNFHTAEMVSQVTEKRASWGDANKMVNEESSSDADNFPFTPQNSMADSNLQSYALGHGLPSFHSAEMVRKIQIKKDSLGDADDTPEESNAGGPDRFPFTPQNSMCESSLDTFAQERGLPSFHSAEMVERIRQKKLSLENIGEEEDDQEGSRHISSDVTSFPFTPQNSVTESHMESAAREHQLLPSFHTPEMLGKIVEKRTEFEDDDLDGDTSIQDAQKFPYAPPSSLVEESLAGHMERQQQERHRSALENEADLMERLSAKSLSFTEEGDLHFGQENGEKECPEAESTAAQNLGDSSPSQTGNELKGSFITAEAYLGKENSATGDSEKAATSVIVTEMDGEMTGVETDDPFASDLIPALTTVNESEPSHDEVVAGQNAVFSSTGDVKTGVHDQTNTQGWQPIGHKSSAALTGSDAGTQLHSQSESFHAEQQQQQQQHTDGGGSGVPGSQTWGSEEPSEISTDIQRSEAEDRTNLSEPVATAAAAAASTTIKHPAVHADADSQNSRSQLEKDFATPAEIDQGSFFCASASNDDVETTQCGGPDTGGSSAMAHAQVLARGSDVISTDMLGDYKPEPIWPSDGGGGDTQRETLDEYAMAESITANAIQLALEVCDSAPPADHVLDTSATTTADINNVDTDTQLLETTPESFHSTEPTPNDRASETMLAGSSDLLPSSESEMAVVETDYLSDIDPLKGNLDLLGGVAPVTADDAESASFNKITSAEDGDLAVMSANITQTSEAENKDGQASEEPVMLAQSPVGLPLPSEQMVTSVGEAEQSAVHTHTVETDYLCSLDPLGGSLGLLAAKNSAELNVGVCEDVPESTSFHKVIAGSGNPAQRHSTDVFDDPFDTTAAFSSSEAPAGQDLFGATPYATGDPFSTQSPDPFEGMSPFGATSNSGAAGDASNVELPSDVFTSLTASSESGALTVKPVSEERPQDDLASPDDAQGDMLGVLAFRKTLQNSGDSHSLSAPSESTEDPEVERERVEMASKIVTQALTSAVRVCEQMEQESAANTQLVDAVEPTQTKEEELPEWSDDDDDDDGEEIKNLRDQIPEDIAMDLMAELQEAEEKQAGQPELENKKVMRPNNLDSTPKKKIVPNMKDILGDEDIDLAVSHSSSDFDIGASVENEKTPDDLTTPDALNDSVFGGELDWESEASVTPVEPIPQYTAEEEMEDQRSWRTVRIGDNQYKIDLKVIEPYKKVLSHGGYYGDGFNAIIVFAACHLPDKGRRDYHYVMDNLFLYVISTLELLVVEDYMIIYFHGAASKNKVPSLRWLKRCYDMIDRRLRKNLKSLLIVHPTLWLKTVMLMTKPFISSKFSSKLRYVKGLQELTTMVPTEYIYVPEEIKQGDQKLNPRKPVPHKKFLNL